MTVMELGALAGKKKLSAPGSGVPAGYTTMALAEVGPITLTLRTRAATPALGIPPVLVTLRSIDCAWPSGAVEPLGRPTPVPVSRTRAGVSGANRPVAGGGVACVTRCTSPPFTKVV